MDTTTLLIIIVVLLFSAEVGTAGALVLIFGDLSASSCAAK